MQQCSQPCSHPGYPIKIPQNTFVTTITTILKNYFWGGGSIPNEPAVIAALNTIYTALGSDANELLIFTSFAIAITNGFQYLGDPNPVIGNTYAPRGILLIQGQTNYYQMATVSGDFQYYYNPPGLALLTTSAVQDTIAYWSSLVAQSRIKDPCFKLTFCTGMAILNLTDVTNISYPDCVSLSKTKQQVYCLVTSAFNFPARI